MNLLKLLFLILVTICSFSDFNAQTISNGDKKRLYREAIFNYENNDLLAALSVFNNLIGHGDADADIYFYCGKCYYELHSYRKATEMFEQTVKINDSYGKEIKLLIAKSYHAISEFAKARSFYQLTLKSVINQKKINTIKRKISECENGVVLKNKTVPANVTPFTNSINTSSVEYALVSSNENSLYFTSTRNAGNKGDVFKAVKVDGNWNINRNATDFINSSGDESSIGFKKSTQQLIIFKNDSYENKKNASGAFITGNNSTDSSLYTLPDIFDVFFRIMSVTLNSAENEMYISANKEWSDDFDIYHTMKTDGNWSTPTKLGDNINSKFDEVSVSLSENDSTLYVASKGHTSIGGFDIFKSHLTDQNGWSRLENVGIPVNTPFDDLFFTCFGDIAFYVSDAASFGDNTDIFEVEFINTVIDTVTPYLNKLRVDLLVDVQKRRIDSAMVVSNYTLPLKRTLDKKVLPMFDSIAIYMNKYSDVNLTIKGFTDAEGSPRFNIWFSEQRATEAKRCLVRRGVDASRVRTIGAGDSQPISMNYRSKSGFEWKSLPFNRRVELSFDGDVDLPIFVEQIDVPHEFRIKPISPNKTNFAIFLGENIDIVKFKNLYPDLILNRLDTDDRLLFYSVHGTDGYTQALSIYKDVSKSYNGCFVYSL